MGWTILAAVWLAALLISWSLFRRERLRTPWHLDVAGLGLVALAVAGFFWRVVTREAWMPADGGDLASFLFPTYRFAAASLSGGAWPLWNPNLYGGAPHIGDIQAGFLYPPNLLLFLTNPRFPYASLQDMSVLHVWFAGAGMYLFLVRGFGLRRIGALAGALTFMFSDVFLTHFGNLNLNAALSWLPWIFWAWLRVLDAVRPGAARYVTRGREDAPRLVPEDLAAARYVTRSREDREVLPRPVAEGLAAEEPVTERPVAERPAMVHLVRGVAVSAILLAVSITAGHIQATLFIILALGLFSLFWLVLRRDEPWPWGRALWIGLSYAATVLLAALLAAPLLLPGLQLAGRTIRAGWSYNEAVGYSLSPPQLIGWLIPGFFGRGPQLHWGLWPRVEVGYLGILPLILAGLAVALQRRAAGNIIWPLVALAAASLALALGIYAIPHGWLTLLPGFGQLRAPARFVVLTDFALAGLAAWGLHALLRPLDEAAGRTVASWTRGLAWATGATFGIVLPLAYVTLLLVQSQDAAIVSRVSVALIGVVSFALLLGASLAWLIARRKEFGRPATLGWLALALIFFDVASLGAYVDTGQVDPSVTFEQAGIAAFLAGQPGPFRIDTRTQIEDLWQPDTALLYGLEEVGGLSNPLLLADTDRYWQALGSRSTPLYDLLNVRYVVGRKDVVLDWEKFVLAYDGDPDLNVYENRRVLPRAFIVPAVRIVASHEAALEAIGVAGFDPTATAVIEGATADQAAGPDLPAGGTGTVTGLQTGPNRLSFRTNADAPALVFVSQVWYPGWQVLIDGRSAGAPLRANYLFQAVSVPQGAHQVELRFAPAEWRIGWLLAAAAALLIVVGVVLSSISGRKHGD